MTLLQRLITIAMCSLATILTRFLPFLVFSSEKKETPPFVRYLGAALPGAVFSILVVYSFRQVSILSGSHGIPELIAGAVTVFLHAWKRQMLVSIAGGTAVYMLLVQMVF